jgi:hypothetical protein
VTGIETESADWLEVTPDGYATEVSVPVLGDNGIQRLHNAMLPEPEPEAEP